MVLVEKSEGKEEKEINVANHHNRKFTDVHRSTSKVVEKIRPKVLSEPPNIPEIVSRKHGDRIPEEH